MAEPIVFISRWRIRHGNRPALEAMTAQAVGFIGSTKPRTALFAAYVDEAGEELRIVHAVPDAAAMTDHFEGSEERSASVEDMIELLGFEVYGAAPDAAVDQLRRETAAVPGAELALMPISIGGYLRAPGWVQLARKHAWERAPTRDLPKEQVDQNSKAGRSRIRRRAIDPGGHLAVAKRAGSRNEIAQVIRDGERSS